MASVKRCLLLIRQLPAFELESLTADFALRKDVRDLLRLLQMEKRGQP